MRSRRSSPRCPCTARPVGAAPGDPRPRRPRPGPARSLEFAATPPPITSVFAPAASAAATSFVSRTSTTAAWNDAATSRASTSGWRRTWLITAVLRPENEKSKPSLRIGRGTRSRPDHRTRANRSIAGTAGIAEAEKARDLVERFAGRVVHGLAEQLVARVLLDDHDHRVATRHDEHRERELDAWILEPGRVQVGFEVVHPDVRNVEGQRQRLRRAHPDQQCAREARPMARGDRVELREVGAGLDERLGDDPTDELRVRAARDLRDHAPEARVQVDLARHDARADVVAVVDDRGRGLVAARLDPEDRYQRRTGS